MADAAAELAPEILAQMAAVRRFNRFYTKRIGVLQEGLLASPFSLTEARVLYELAQRDPAAPGLSAAALARALALDPGYLSRILAAFAARGLIAKRPSAQDGRQSLLSLTEAGRAAFAPLDARSRDETGAMLRALSESQRRQLLAALAAVERLLDAPAAREPYLLRPHQPGDIGWVISRHGALYAEE